MMNSSMPPEHLELSNELLETATRKQVIATTVISSAWLLMIASFQSGKISMIVVPTIVLICFSFWAVYSLISKNLKLAQIVWLVCFAATVTTALLLFGKSEIGYLYALLPLMAITTLGWQAAVLTGSALVALLFTLTFWPGLALISYFQIGMISFGAILSGFIGWSAISPLLTMVAWTSYSYRMASENLEEARNQRLELKQVQEDLLLANNEQVRLSNSLKVMTEKAEEARRVKEEFVANVSHELRTPLNMIIGFTNLIIKSPQAYAKRLPVRLLADIASIQRNSQHLVELINDVLDLSQVDAGRMAMTRQWSLLEEIIDSAVVAVEPLFHSKGLYLEKDVQEKNLQVYCDSTRIREVVLNLLSNAGRLTEQGGIIVRAWRENEALVVSVTDTGPGISSEDQNRLFEPFQQLDTMLHHRTGGSGLGLSISKRFVEMHEGKMWLESEVGRGTTFFFQIPERPHHDVDEWKPTASRWVNPYQEYIPRQRASRAPHPVYAPRFVIVDPEHTIQHLFERYLDSVTLLSASNLEDAASQMANLSAQVMVVNTPYLEEERLAALQLPPNLPVISCWIPGRDEAARRLGVIHYLLKPVEQDLLLSALDKLGKEKMSVLLVDDDLETLHLFARIISTARPSFRVIRASSGQEALQVMKERRPDVVLLDLILPDINGFEILAEKRKDAEICDIPVIVVSSTDPSGIPIVANRFSLHRSGGLSIREFIACLMSVNESLNPSLQKSYPEQTKSASA
jgi:signal transduction histidine kinase